MEACNLFRKCKPRTEVLQRLVVRFSLIPLNRREGFTTVSEGGRDSNRRGYRKHARICQHDDDEEYSSQDEECGGHGDSLACAWSFVTFSACTIRIPAPTICDVIRSNVQMGLAHARKQGKTLGRPAGDRR